MAIIGGGLSGALVAIHLLRRARAGRRVLLIERRPPAGPGLAYNTNCPVHQLNVAAGRMSLFEDEPDHFLRWVRQHLGHVGFPDRVDAEDYLPRSLYGAYIRATLEGAAAARAEFENIAGEAVDIEEGAGRPRVSLADGRSFEADAVVLAIGNLPGEYPIARSLTFYRGPRYVHVPWLSSLMGNVGKRDDVLIVGAGLTAIDIILQLDQMEHRGTIHALSRRGLRPLPHRLGLPAYPHFLAEGPLPSTVRALVRRVRAEVRRAAARGVDWRPVVDAIREQSSALWRGWSTAEKARFMRHVRPYWEVHRHRLSPDTMSRVERLAAENRVRFIAGRLESLRDTPTQAEAVLRPRGSERRVTLQVAKVINCTGPRTDYSKYQHPLLINLLARGLIDHDPLALGVKALPDGEVLRYRKGPTGWLFTLGPPLKGMLWESTGLREIRVQARDLAGLIEARFLAEEN